MLIHPSRHISIWMPSVYRPPAFICARCWRATAHQRHLRAALNVRPQSNLSTPPKYALKDDEPTQGGRDDERGRDGEHGQDSERGAMSRRLAQMSEESLETGGSSARKAIEEAGFDEDLKRRLEEKITNAGFRSDHASAFAQADMPSSAGRGTRDIAAAQPWRGTESVEDSALRMLTDVYKPMRVPARPPGLRGPPAKIDTGRPKSKSAPGARLANARDKTSIYAVLKDPNMSEAEREKFHAEMKARFEPTSRAVPATVQGLASLANKRIEDAIARGQFKNLPRGKKIERDYNASSPFIDTTEYFMNKIIQKQEIVPPWIEKQQELVSIATRFRGRLRADWRRHVSRTIASQGGGLDKLMKIAEQYALAEERANPSRKKVEQFNAVDDTGRVSQITLSGELKPAAMEGTLSPESEIKIVEQTFDEDGALKPDLLEEVTVSTEEAHPHTPPPSQQPPLVPPFRDPQWEQIERPYHLAAVANLNTLTRSYNLMAPDLAKKPYFSLDRELKACFADVAPTVANAIRERAVAPKIKGVEIIGHKPGSVLEKFAMDGASHVYDSRKPQYGFKEFWRDLFSSKKT